MAYVKLAPLTLFLLATSLLIFPMKKVEACGGSACSLVGQVACEGSCFCFPIAGIFVGVCTPYSSLKKMVEEHPNLCLSHADCEKKGSGSFCASYPNIEVKFGWCFVSSSHAQASFNIALNSEFANLFSKMSSAISA